MEKKLKIDDQGVHVVSTDVSTGLEQKKLSASLITGLEQCPARWVSDNFVVNELVEKPAGNAMEKGKLFHKVMEEFFHETPENRTTGKIKEVVNRVLQYDEYKHLAEMPEVVDWLKNAINSYYSMGAKPQKVKVATLKDDWGREKQGLEFFVKGKIGNTKREILGFIDRVLDAGNSRIIVEDWKTGGKAKPEWDPNKKSDEGLAEARQQMIYTKLLSDKGYQVAAARLIYPVAKTILNVNIDSEELQNRVVEDVETADRVLDDYIDRNTFEYKPSFLCAWCPIAKICPQAMIKPYPKMLDAYAEQPEPELLNEGFAY